MEAWVRIPLLTEIFFFNGIVSQCIWYEYVDDRYHVRMAEWSKTPDSRTIVCIDVQCFGVLVSSGGVGSNPTSDRDLFFNGIVSQCIWYEYVDDR